jgi:hypothetical protein
VRHESENPADVLVEHMAECTDAKAAIVVDGNADEIVDRLVEAGWTLQDRVDVLVGKRIRFMSPPPTGPGMTLHRGDLISYRAVHADAGPHRAVVQEVQADGVVVLDEPPGMPLTHLVYWDRVIGLVHDEG